MVSEYSKEVHAVKKVRFEIKLSAYRDGRTLARIYDDYWDSMDIDLFEDVYKRQVPVLLILPVSIIWQTEDDRVKTRIVLAPFEDVYKRQPFQQFS